MPYSWIWGRSFPWRVGRPDVKAVVGGPGDHAGCDVGDDRLDGAGAASGLEILVFGILNFTFGIESRQIERVGAVTDAPVGTDLYYFHEKLPLRALIGAYRIPSVIFPRGTGSNIGIIVDRLADFRTVDPREKMEIPRIMQGSSAMTPLSFIVSDGREMVFVVDLERLIGMETHGRDMPLPGGIKTRRVVDPVSVSSRGFSLT